MQLNSRNIAYNLIIFGLVLVGLYFGKDLLIPFVVALVIWFLINSLKKFMAGIKIGKKMLPLWIRLLIPFVFLSVFFFFMGRLINSNLQEFSKVYPQYEKKVLDITDDLGETYNLPAFDLRGEDEESVQNRDNLANNLDIAGVVSSVLNSSIGFLGNVVLILFYVLFLLLEEPLFTKKLKLIFPDEEKRLKFRGVLEEIDKSVHTYVTIKTGLCLLSAVSSYVVLVIVGVDFAVLWAILIFMFCFIPIIGSFMAVLFPTLLAFLQFEDYTYALIVMGLLGAIQFVVGNFIDPKVLGNRLNLSPLVVVLSLTFWGAIWGVAGMFLCVPITVILMIALRKFPKTRYLAIMLSNGA